MDGVALKFRAKNVEKTEEGRKKVKVNAREKYVKGIDNEMGVNVGDRGR